MLDVDSTFDLAIDMGKVGCVLDMNIWGILVDSDSVGFFHLCEINLLVFLPLRSVWCGPIVCLGYGKSWMKLMLALFQFLDVEWNPGY
jgi:hypothetical protein